MERPFFFFFSLYSYHLINTKTKVGVKTRAHRKISQRRKKKKGAAFSGRHSGKEKLPVEEEEEEEETDIFLTEVHERKVRSACRGGGKG